MMDDYQEKLTQEETNAQENEYKLPETLHETPEIEATAPEEETQLEKQQEKEEIEPKIIEQQKVLEEEETIYHVKWIKFNNKTLPIILQNKNGPCPLIAISNILLLREQIKLNSNATECVRESDLMTYLANALLALNKIESLYDNDPRKVNLETNLNDAISSLPSLKHGLLINNRFDKTTSFEYTSEMNTFDLFNINLYHGWLIDPQQIEIYCLASSLSYNQLVEKIINLKQSNNANDDLAKGLLLEDFLTTTASQLTVYGLAELQQTIKERELAVFFRNNHFSTLYKFKEQLYVLVTDQGFLARENIVWETLADIDGDSFYCDSNFKIYTELNNNENVCVNETSDRLLALGLDTQANASNDMTDEQYARELQKKEQREVERQRQSHTHSQKHSQRERRQSTSNKTSDCQIL